jgi:hypothetical protein
VLLTIIEIMLARCTENFISHLNIGFVELASLVSYRFVSIAVATLCLVITNMSIPYLNMVLVVYILLADIYFCVILELILETGAEQLRQGKICRGGTGSQDSTVHPFCQHCDPAVHLLDSVKSMVLNY